MSEEEQALIRPVSDLLILVFIHGFKGDDETFLEFPQRMQHILTDTVPHCKVESIVFPVYEVCRIIAKVRQSLNYADQRRLGERLCLWRLRNDEGRNLTTE